MAQALLVTCWRQFGWNHWSAKAVKKFSGYCTSRFDFMTRISEGELFLIPLKLRCSVRLYCRYGPFCDHLRPAFCKRLQVGMQAGTDARMRPSFKLEETARVRMLGKGGKTIGDFVRPDIPVIQIIGHSDSVAGRQRHWVCDK